MTIQPLNTIPYSPDLTQTAQPAAKAKAVSTEKSTSVSAKTNSDQPAQVDTSRMADEMNKIVEKMGVELSFSVDSDLDMVVVTVSKAGSEEVIRQIPSKEMVEMSRRLRELAARGDAKGMFLGVVS